MNGWSRCQAPWWKSHNKDLTGDQTSQTKLRCMGFWCTQKVVRHVCTPSTADDADSQYRWTVLTEGWDVQSQVGHYKQGKE